MATHDWLNIQTESGSEGTTQVTVSANSNHTGRVARQKTITGTTTSASPDTDTTVVSQTPADLKAAFDKSSDSIGAATTSIVVTGTANAKSLHFSFTENGARFELPGTMTIGYSNSRSITVNITNGAATITGDIGADEEYTFSMTLTCPANDSVSSKMSILSMYGKGDGASETTPVTTQLSHAGGTSSIDMTGSITLGNKSGNSGTLTITSNDGWELSVN